MAGKNFPMLIFFAALILTRPIAAHADGSAEEQLKALLNGGGLDVSAVSNPEKDREVARANETRLSEDIRGKSEQIEADTDAQTESTKQMLKDVVHKVQEIKHDAQRVKAFIKDPVPYSVGGVPIR